MSEPLPPGTRIRYLTGDHCGETGVLIEPRNPDYLPYSATAESGGIHSMHRDAFEVIKETRTALSIDEMNRMETRVMSIGCTDQDFRRLADSHEALRNRLAALEGRAQS